jgi:hypothetical protein
LKCHDLGSFSSALRQHFALLKALGAENARMPAALNA